MNISTYPDQEILKIAFGFKKHLKDKYLRTANNVAPLDEAFIYRFKALFYEVQSQHKTHASEEKTQRYLLALEDLTEQARAYLIIFRFYLQKAFPYDSELAEQYGYVEMERIKQDHAEMRNLLEKTISIIRERNKYLAAANCPECTLEGILTLSNKISEVHDEMIQEEQRLNELNNNYKQNIKELFSLMEQIHIYASDNLKDEPEKLKYFILPATNYVH